jgi:hypothetical protein
MLIIVFRVRHIAGQGELVISKMNILDYNSTGIYELSYSGTLDPPENLDIINTTSSTIDIQWNAPMGN